MAGPRIRAILFDKDGTLFDFKASWGAWMRAFLIDYAAGDVARAIELGNLIGYDYNSSTFQPDSVVIAGTNQDLAHALAAGLGEVAAREMLAAINTATAGAQMAEAVPLVPFLEGLRKRGLALGVATNDAEASARAHLRALGLETYFDFIAGYDSGHGGKPAPGMLLAFARALGVPAAQVLMVGDSTHDLLAGRAAGMGTVGVLTGIAKKAALAPHADVILPDIGYLPDWLDAQAKGGT